MSFDTAVNVLNDAAIELGLYPTALADPYDSTDPNVLQLIRLMNGLGQDLLRDHPWSHLTKVYTFPTVNGTVTYALPTDFDRFIDGTIWNRSTATPLEGPLGQSAWQAIQAGAISNVVGQAFAMFGRLVYLTPTPSSAETIGYSYISNYWVDRGGGTTPDNESSTDGTDTLHMDRRLMILGSKLLFQGEKGFDALLANSAFQAAYLRAKGADGAAPVLSLSMGGGLRFVDASNLPETGYGG